MAIAELQLAPVITPRTLDELARILREGQREDSAASLLELKQVVNSVIENCFRPISQVRNKTKFWPSFHKYSRDFEPYRLYINLKLIELLGSENLFESYRTIFQEVSESLLKGAEAKAISAERLKRVLDNYIESFASLLDSLMNVGEFGEAARIEQINLADWLRSATQLDFSLTAVFLILEEEIPLPPKRVCDLLIVASERFLSEFKNYSVMLATILASSSVGKEKAQKPVRFRGRALELDWLKRHAASMLDFAGKWIVVQGDQLLASDSSYEKARAIAQEKGVQRPFIIYVPLTTEEAFMGI
ncbi:MAG: hypothetical protein ACE5HL_00905 [Terriglobia bacterium]